MDMIFVVGYKDGAVTTEKTGLFLAVLVHAEVGDRFVLVEIAFQSTV